MSFIEIQTLRKVFSVTWNRTYLPKLIFERNRAIELHIRILRFVGSNQGHGAMAEMRGICQRSSRNGGWPDVYKKQFPERKQRHGMFVLNRFFLYKVRLFLKIDILLTAVEYSSILAVHRQLRGALAQLPSAVVTISVSSNLKSWQKQNRCSTDKLCFTKYFQLRGAYCPVRQMRYQSHRSASFFATSSVNYTAEAMLIE